MPKVRAAGFPELRAVADRQKMKGRQSSGEGRVRTEAEGTGGVNSQGQVGIVATRMDQQDGPTRVYQPGGTNRMAQPGWTNRMDQPEWTNQGGPTAKTVVEREHWQMRRTLTGW